MKEHHDHKEEKSHHKEQGKKKHEHGKEEHEHHKKKGHHRQYHHDRGGGIMKKVSAELICSSNKLLTYRANLTPVTSKWHWDKKKEDEKKWHEEGK